MMFPFLMLAALAAAVMGILNTYRRYFVPALAPAAFNLVAVAGGGVLLLLGLPEVPALHVWAWLVVGGGLAQVLVQLPALRAVGYRGAPVADLRFSDPLLRSVAARMGPVVIGLAGTNVMLLITTMLASREQGWAPRSPTRSAWCTCPSGSWAWPSARCCSPPARGARPRATRRGSSELVRRGLRLSWFLAAPAAVGLFVLAEPLVRLVYQHGRFGPGAVADTAEALRWYAAAVVGYAGVKAGAPRLPGPRATRARRCCARWPGSR